MYLDRFGDVLPESRQPSKTIHHDGSMTLVEGAGTDDKLYSAANVVLAGGAGDDTYHIWHADSSIKEAVGAGIDTMYAYFYGKAVLPDNVENLFLERDGLTVGTGNGLNNIIRAGGIGARLNGLGGNDLLIGGRGADIFEIAAGNGSDAVENFQSGYDVILLKNYGIGDFGQLVSLGKQQGDDVLFSFANGESLLVRGVVLSDLHGFDFGFAMDPAHLRNNEVVMDGAGRAQNWNGWYVINNAWGTSGLVKGVDYTIDSSFDRADATAGTVFNWTMPYTTESGSRIMAYPEVAFGVPPMGAHLSNPGDKAAVFPVAIDSLTALTIDFDVSFSGNVAGFNVAFDIWLTNVPNGGRDTITNEIMIWVHKGEVNGWGPVIGTYEEDGITFQIHHKGTYTALIADRDVPQGQFDFTAMIARLKQLGIVGEGEYLASIELGAEVVSGVGSLTINNLDFTVSSLGPDGSTIVKTVTGSGQTTQVVPAETPEAQPDPAPAPPPTDDPVTVGKATDGVLSDATIWQDANGNSVLDAGEWHTTSDAAGTFGLPASGAGALRLTGGVNGDTGLSNLLELAAPEGSHVINPLTTVVQSLVESGYGSGEAQTIAKLAFGLDAGIDLLETDVLGAAHSGDSAAFLAQKTAVGIANFVLIAHSNQENPSWNASDAIFDAIAGRIAAGGTIDLTDADTLRDLLGRGGYPGDAATIADFVARTNGAIFSASDLVGVADAQKSAALQGADLSGTDAGKSPQGSSDPSADYGAPLAVDDGLFVSQSHTLSVDDLFGTLAVRDAASVDAINLTGNYHSQTIRGNEGANIINGMGGADTMIGLGGDDTYLVRSLGDRVIEANGGGNDIVYTTVDYSLGANEVETLSTVYHVDTTPINLIGNYASQRVVGNYGNNVLNGGSGGLDTLIGLYGDDIYAVGDSRTIIEEHDGQGFDTLVTSVDYALAAGVSIELMAVQDRGGGEAISLRGNEFAQTIAGNEGANRIDGGGGADTLYGGGGADRFGFSTELGGDNIVTIGDFESGVDGFDLSQAIFGITAVTDDNFVIGGAARDADDRVIYDRDTGELFFDPDGNGAAEAILFARIAPGSVVSASDFDVLPSQPVP